MYVIVHEAFYKCTCYTYCTFMACLRNIFEYTCIMHTLYYTYRLTIETDYGDPTFTFNHPASELVGGPSNDDLTRGGVCVRPSVTLSHDLTLTNLTDTILTCRISHLDHPYSLHMKSRVDNITLRPQHKITVSTVHG